MLGTLYLHYLQVFWAQGLRTTNSIHCFVATGDEEKNQPRNRTPRRGLNGDQSNILSVADWKDSWMDPHDWLVDWLVKVSESSIQLTT